MLGILPFLMFMERRFKSDHDFTFTNFYSVFISCCSQDLTETNKTVSCAKQISLPNSVALTIRYMLRIRLGQARFLVGHRILLLHNRSYCSLSAPNVFYLLDLIVLALKECL